MTFHFLQSGILWTIVIPILSAFVVWHEVFKGEDKISFGRKWAGLLLFILLVMTQGSVAFVFLNWPSRSSKIVTAVWILIGICAIWTLVPFPHIKNPIAKAVQEEENRQVG